MCVLMCAHDHLAGHDGRHRTDESNRAALEEDEYR
jgi:hypothetical protein